MTDETPDRYAGLPEAWSLSARETYVQVTEANPYLDPVATTTLFESCALLALADEMDAQVREEGLMVEGSRSRVAHPLIAEIRHARLGAMAALRALGLSRGSTASAAGAALVGHRYRASR